MGVLVGQRETTTVRAPGVLIERNLILSPIVELCRARRLVRGYLLRVF
jgi:hypothetical protein